MINKISIKGPASYKNMAIFETDKNINLIYGLNGSGKSTLSEFLRKRTDNEYAECSISPLLDEDAEEILVYNENYVNDVFYSSDTQKGIFSLSKENAGARKRIDAANAALQVANRDFQKQELLQEKELEAWTSTKSIFANRFWQIKTQYTGGDRVLEYCFTGLKSSKELLLNHIVGLAKPSNKLVDSIDQLKEEIQRLNEAKGTQIPLIQEITFSAGDIEIDSLFKEVITGNANSRVAKLIDSLHNSDWVKVGLSFDTKDICPFCQRPYLDDDIIAELRSYFNEDYEYGETLENEDAILLRSASLHEYEFTKNVKAIARAGAGVNNIPVEKCSEKGIVVFNTPGANANAVKELVLCALFLSSCKIVESIEWVNTLKDYENVGKTAEKGKSNFVGPEIEGKKLGVIGLGAIGVLVANAANKLGMEVYGYDPFMSVNSAWALSKHVRQAKDMDEIFKTCDYITVHVPSTKDTKGMLNKEKFALMKDGARLLNFARGDLVVNEDLLEAVESGKLSKYITDFASQELIGKDNIIVLPHLGASTPESEDNCAKMAVQELKDFLENGNIKNSVNFPAVNQPRESKVRLCITNKNMPNILARISKLFADHNLNIENMVNRSRGDYAYTLIDTNDDVRQDIIERIEAAEGIINVRVIK